ncbi:hypothetical protein QC762_303097 [Podospora pseudocomata]|uniref:Extracellular membrane protein CFEM domain-containing protein n=1 Tax=Podospora pseudocomata TaxID=2093779 RepID=A0ABR0GIM7_9PEZI|nr:hypothetical protein QC762_303097 [Podospora pseudocomata]
MKMRLLALLASASLITALVPPAIHNPEPMAGINLPREALPLITSAPNPLSPLSPRQDRPESPSPCFTEVVTTTTSCVAIGECTSGPHTSLVCHADYICRSDSQGNPSCMYRESSLGVAGTIIAICFAAALVISVFSICFLCCRERREQTRLEKAAEAQKLLKESKVASKRPNGRNVTGGVTGVGTEGSGYGSGNNGGDVGQQTGYAGAQGGQGNPFADSGEGALR